MFITVTLIIRGLNITLLNNTPQILIYLLPILPLLTNVTILK